jgi:glycosyltransferase involved in cell wall biosynthesis
MKIFYLVHQFFPEYQSGTEKFVFNSALMAQRNGNKVKVITYSSYDNSFYKQEKHGLLFTEFSYKGIPVIAFKYQQIPAHINVVLHNNLLFGFAQAILNYEKPDLIQVGHLMRVHEFLWAAIELQIPYSITLTDFFLLCPKINLLPNKLTLCNGPRHGKACVELCKEFNTQYILDRLSQTKTMLANAKSIVAPSKFAANIFKQEIPDFQIEIIPHGIHYLYAPKNYRSFDFGDEIVIGYIGNSYYHKGLHILLSAFNQLAHKHIYLKIFGIGQDQTDLNIEEINKNNDRISLVGKFETEQLGDVFGNIDILVIPSKCYETYSYVLHEALACNVPVIASNLGALSEEIQDGFNGFLFNPGDTNHLLEKLELIIDQPTLLNTIKKNIYMHCIVPTIEQEAYRYFQVYNRILKER